MGAGIACDVWVQTTEQGAVPTAYEETFQEASLWAWSSHCDMSLPNLAKGLSLVVLLCHKVFIFFRVELAIEHSWDWKT